MHQPIIAREPQEPDSSSASQPRPSQPRKTVGRPRLLSDVKKAEIAAMISVGCTRAMACRYVGCVPETLRNELRRDATFREQIIKAERRCQLIPLQHIQNASARSWRAAAWLLERVNPAEFARRDPEAVTRKDMDEYMKRIVGAICDELTPEHRRRLESRLRADRVSESREQIESLIGDDPALADPLGELAERSVDGKPCDGNGLSLA